MSNFTTKKKKTETDLHDLNLVVICLWMRRKGLQRSMTPTCGLGRENTGHRSETAWLCSLSIGDSGLERSGEITSLSFSVLLPGNCLPRRGRDCGHMRAPAKSYVTVLAPLLARWLKRRRKEDEKTCEQLRTLVRDNFLCLIWFFFSCTNRRAVLTRNYVQRNVTALLQLTVYFYFYFSYFLCSSG